MTRPVRRDKDLKGASIITGLRLEPELAAALVARAREWQEGPKADAAATARVLLRMAGMGLSVTLAGAAEADPFPAIPCAGLRCEKALVTTLRQVGARNDLPVAGAARHLLRLALGWPAAKSLARETAFAEIAEARKKLASAYSEGA